MVLLKMSLLFVYVKQVYLFFRYDIPVILVWFLCELPIILADFFATRIRIRIIDTDPGGQNDTVIEIYL